MSQELGLNIDPTKWNITTTDRNRRIRIWWAVYIQERWSAFALGRSPNINDDTCTTPMVTLENFSTQGYKGSVMSQTSAQIFIAIAWLSTILTDVLKNFYTIKAISRLQTLLPEEVLNLIGEFEERLACFHQDHMVPLYTVDTFLDSTGMYSLELHQAALRNDLGTVFLAFYTMEIILCRAALRNVDPEHPQYPTLRWRARGVAKNVVLLLEKMQVSRLRAFWWSRKYSASKS